jgi:hypothetical protein
VRNLIRLVLLLILALPLGGCGVLAALLLPTTVMVWLVNDSDYPVEVTLFIHDEQDLPEFLLTEVGDELNFTVPAGQLVTFARGCEDLQAIMIEDADLLVIGGMGPEANTNVLRDGDDFGCGSTIVFTFSHSAAVTDFEITTLVE